MNFGSLEQPLSGPKSDVPAVDPNELWAAYEENPESYDGVALAIQRSWTGMVIAGGSVAVLVFVCWLVVTAIGGYVSPIQWGLSLPTAAILFFVGGLIIAFWSVFAVLVVMVLNFAFWEMFDRRTAVVIYSGGAAFLTFYWPLYDYPSQDVSSLVRFGSIVLFAMVTCQFGAIWKGNRELAFYRPPRTDLDSAATFQFKITHIMIAMALFGVLCAVDQASENHEVLVMATVYGVLQSILLSVDWLFFRARV